jgi:hypothetical protein
METTLFEVLVVWPIPLSIELGIVALFVWIARDKPQIPSK